MKKAIKGSFEYRDYKRKREIVITVFMYALSLGLFFMGWISTGTKTNLLTIVAILGCLPASKSLISTIMQFKVKAIDADMKKRIDEHIGELDGYYQLLFTSAEVNYMIDHLVITTNSIIGYSSDEKMDEKSFENHISKYLKLEGINDCLIKVFDSKDNYIRRLDELNNIDNSKGNDAVANVLLSISL